MSRPHYPTSSAPRSGVQSQLNSSVSALDRLDRARTCPMLVRAFIQVGRHFDSSEYSSERTPPEKSALAIYTWRDATLGELAEQIRAQLPEARSQSTKGLEFALVFPDKTGHFQLRTMGTVRGSDSSEASATTLEKGGLQVGDYLDVAIL